MSAGMKGLEERLRVYAVSDPDESRPGELRVGPMMLRQICDEAADRIATLEAEVVRLRVDAERYRFVRNRDPGPEGELPPAGLFIGTVPENLILTEEDADDAIDRAALAAGEG